MGVLDRRVLKALKTKAREVFKLIRNDIEPPGNHLEPPPVVFQTHLGRLHQGDCLALMQHLESDSIDLIFADPIISKSCIFPESMMICRKLNISSGAKVGLASAFDC